MTTLAPLGDIYIHPRRVAAIEPRDDGLPGHLIHLADGNTLIAITDLAPAQIVDLL